MTAAIATDARARVDRIKTGVEVIWQLIVESYQARDWEALGYATWDEMCTREFGTSRLRLPREERAETVQSLRDAGLSLRAIGAATGVSHEEARRVLASAPVTNVTPPFVDPVGVVGGGFVGPEWVDHNTGEILEPEGEDWADRITADVEASESQYVTPTLEPTKPITGIDGKTYPHAQVKKPPRRALPDEFRGAVLDLNTKVDRISRLGRDDRFNSNADQIAQSYLHDLIRARDALQCVINQLDH